MQQEIAGRVVLPGRGGGSKKRIRNLFAEIARCGLCGAPMRFHDQGVYYLRCSRAYQSKSCEGTRVRYDRLETLLLYLCGPRGFNPKDLDDAIEAERRQAHEALAAANGKLISIQKEVDNLKRAIARTDDDALAQEVEAELKGCLARRRAAESERDALTAAKQQLEANGTPSDRLRDIGGLIAHREGLGNDQRRDFDERLMRKLQGLMPRIEVTSRGSPQEFSVMVAFQAGHPILLLLDAKGRVRLVEGGAGDQPSICRIDAQGNLIEQSDRQVKVDAVVAKALRNRGINPQNLAR